MQDGITSLRESFPALSLVTGFACPSERAILADLLLLWLEVNRARRSSESMVAAARLSWWRDSLSEGRGESVPLAERLILSLEDTEAVTRMLQEVIEAVLNGDDEHRVYRSLGEMMARLLDEGRGRDEIGLVLSVFDKAMSGEGVDSGVARDLMSSDILVPFKLIVWLGEDRGRLDYPLAHRFLPLRMMLKAFWL